MRASPRRIIPTRAVAIETVICVAIEIASCNVILFGPHSARAILRGRELIWSRSVSIATVMGFLAEAPAIHLGILKIESVIREETSTTRGLTNAETARLAKIVTCNRLRTTAFRLGRTESEAPAKDFRRGLKGTGARSQERLARGE